MGVEVNNELVRRYVELYNTGNLVLADEIFAPDFVDHLHPELAPGPESVKQEVATFRAAFPDAHVTVEQMISEGDTVAFRFVLRATHVGMFGGFPPTGREVVLTGMDFVYIAHGRFVELWSSQDTLGWVQQLGMKIESLRGDASRSWG